MSNADRIEELQAKYEENPRRYFAPLANEHRKAGDLAQAIAICREHLPKQPGHMSGYIVFGQTLFEANNLDEARSVFEQALTLDSENLIALKHLGDIARMNGENGVARRWYARVLDADPRNDDIASQLASLGSPTPIVPLAAVPAPVPYSEPPLQEAVGVFATFDPALLLDVPEDVVGIAGANEFWSPIKAQPPVQHEPLDLDFPDSAEPVSEADFEEGLMAPEWPDTTELVARIVTPLRSATPISVPATADVVQAFGREPSDEVDAAPADFAPRDELVEAFLPPEPTVTVMIAQVIDDEPENPVAAFSEPLSVAVDEPSAEFESAERDVIAFESVVDVSSSADAQASAAQPFDAPATEELVETEMNVLSWSEPESVPAQVQVAEIEDFAFAAELPWQAESESELESEPTAVPIEFETDAMALAVTAEFPIPTRAESGGYAAIESTELVEPAPTEALVSATAELPEESFAEISSELQIERDASDNIVQELEAEATAEAYSAETAEVSAEARTADSEAQPFVTETMAELLVSQGFQSRAIEVYDELVRRRPHDPVLASRLAELREMEAAAVSAAEGVTGTATPRYTTPVRSTPIFNTPLYNTPLSTTPVSVPSMSDATATQSNLSERNGADRQQAFRTARERFAELSRRRVARRTPAHATAVADDASEGLSSLFGTTAPATTDELAARALADAFGPVPDRGESLFDPAPMQTPSLSMRSLTPRASSVVSPTPSASRSDRESSADYSFDKFFPDPAMSAREAQSSSTTVAPTPSSAQPVNEDLAQFSAWLKGLNNA